MADRVLATRADRMAPLVVAVCLLVVSLALLAAYWPGLGGGFVFDDFPNIVDNTALHVTAQATWGQWLAAIFSSPSSDMQRPLAMLTFAANHAATGLDPFWMKLTNLVIHLLNTWLVFGLVRCVLRVRHANASDAGAPDRQALWIAATWALNPINFMAVLFVVQRMESLSHTFVFAGLWIYLAGRQRMLRGERGWLLILGGLLGGTGVGMLAKESAALLPLYALALEWSVLRFRASNGADTRWLQRLYAAVLVLPGLAALAWQLPKVVRPSAYANRDFSLLERLLTEPRVVVDYLHWTLVPDLGTLSLYHDDYLVSHGLLSPPSTLACIVVLLLLAAAAWVLRRRRPLMALGISWFLIAQLLTATVLPLELVYEHRNYFASLGVCIVLGDLLWNFAAGHRYRRPAIALACGVLCFYGGLTSLRAREWSDQLRFAQTEAAKHPRSPRATYDLARDYIVLSKYRPGSNYIPLAKTALERAMHAPGASPLPEAAAILLAARTGSPVAPSLFDRFRDKLRRQPIGAQEVSAITSLVDCQLQHACVFPPGSMLGLFQAALEHSHKPELFNVYGNYALNVLHDPALALRLWEEAADRAPTVVQYQATMAKMLVAVGQPQLATPYIARIRQLGRLGQNETVARRLELLQSQARLRGR